MDYISKLKLSVFESHDAGIIDDKTMTEMISVCESADIDNTEDREKLSDIVDRLIRANESADQDNEDENNDDTEVNESVEEALKDLTSLKLTIYESADSKEITTEERDILLSLLP